ncbi:DUF2934 domain-containing protein [Steroidobacter sp. S1-65]|uniref:DUF2934 domain-containing protein n=1 Tax=Steroidobacter gossypii TaxID=2805490 RepID=A0ABS1WQH4_9GAMM|nr:DUF2934 domain-containing protein [Steroidobacter gossypii]MBM0103230.1 DUF2934 domain-containing protein [Steroidobacter gossypii]
MKPTPVPPERPKNPTHFGGEGLYEDPQLRDAPESKSDASASGPGLTPDNARMSPEQHDRIAKRAYELAAQRDFRAGHELDDWLQAEREIEAGPARNTPPDNPFDTVKTSSNEDR